MYLEIVKNRKEDWEDLRDNLTIYELNLPRWKDVEGIQGRVVEWQSKRRRERDSSWYYGSSTHYLGMEIVKVFSNPKGSIKVALLGDGNYLVAPMDGEANSITRVELKSENKKLFFDIREGKWAIVPYQSGNVSKSLGIIAESTDGSEILQMLEIFDEITKAFEEWRYYNWKDVEYDIEATGILELSDALTLKQRFYDALRRYRWEEQLERWSKELTLRDYTKITMNSQIYRIQIRALDGNLYSLEAENKEFIEGWPRNLWDSERFWDFINPKANYGKAYDSEALCGTLVNLSAKAYGSKVKLGCNKRSVSYEIQRSKSGSSLHYLNGSIVAESDITKKIVGYLLMGTPLFPVVKGPSQTYKRGLSDNAKKLIEEGLNGEMIDLEGRLPFHLNLSYKEDERKWYLECAGKEYYVPGGMTALSKIKSAISGTAIIDHSKYKWEHGGRSGTRLIRDRLAELVGDKEALEIVINVKKFGAMCKAMESEKD